MPVFVPLFAVASLLSTVQSQSLPVQWNASISTVLDVYPQSVAPGDASARVLEAKDIVFDGVVWKLARFKFDRTGHVMGLQLVADGNASLAVKAELRNAASPLWDPMDDEVARASQASSSSSVTLCNNGEETTLTYARPSQNQPLLITASTDVSLESSAG